MTVLMNTIKNEFSTTPPFIITAGDVDVDVELKLFCCIREPNTVRTPNCR